MDSKIIFKSIAPPRGPAETAPLPVLTETPPQRSRGSAPVYAGWGLRAAADPFARRSRHCIQKKRRFAAEEWVKPEVDPVIAFLREFVPL